MCSLVTGAPEEGDMVSTTTSWEAIVKNGEKKRSGREDIFIDDRCSTFFMNNDDIISLTAMIDDNSAGSFYRHFGGLLLSLACWLCQFRIPPAGGGINFERKNEKERKGKEKGRR